MSPGPATGDAEQLRPLDGAQIAALRQLADIAGPERLMVLVRLFTDRADQLLEQLESGTGARAAERAAHELTGSAGTIGARWVAEVARRIEIAARSGRIPDPGELAELRSELDRARSALAALGQ